MDLRTKLILALVAVSLGSMAALGAVIAPRVQSDMRNAKLDELQVLAEAKAEAVSFILERYAADSLASPTDAVDSLDPALRARVVDFANHEHGLGESGEVMVVAAPRAGVAQTLHPTRHRPDAEVVGLGPDGSALIRAALEGEAVSAWEDVRDYRGIEVWAAAARVPGTEWAVLVKLDAAGEVTRYDAFFAELRRVALVLSAFAILAGFGLGLRFASPVTELAEAAENIRKGDLGARAKVTREDEVGVLARTFNEMADEIEQQVSLLHQFRKFFDVSIDLMCIANTEGYFERTNPAFTRVLGWTKEELLSRPFFDLVHPDDLASTEAEVVKLAQGIPTISFRNRFLRMDGGYTELRWTSYPEEGKLYAIAHVVQPDTPEAAD